MSTVNYIVGHHVITDVIKIKNDLIKYNINVPKDLLSKLNYYKCTRSMFKNLFKGESKLSDIYRTLFGKQLLGAHDALNDVECTAECYKKLNYLTQVYDLEINTEDFVDIEKYNKRIF